MNAAAPVTPPSATPAVRTRARSVARVRAVRSAPVAPEREDTSDSPGDKAAPVEVADGSLDNGGDVVASPAALVSGSCTDTLEYPASALDSRHEGTVHMLVSIDEEGRVLQAKLTEHVGFGLD
ncbi:MAG TPA: hypothetical protein VHB97_23405, partial [Polyangia bacterium]|nr:hypothetical protein [Polyangia bacterium]